MGLYDNYKLNNSSYISQFVGSIVPELQDFSKVMKQRYDEARDTDDALVEAMGNLQHLDTEEDTTYANELKQNYLNRVMDRSSREDYENMGRRTQRDAKAFSSDYVPLVNRMKGMQAIQERVLQDEKIFAPETKAGIMRVIKKRNSMGRDEKGNFERDAVGKIKLGAIQDWAYAKDVDVNKKLADLIDKLEPELSQTPFRPDGRGLMTSTTREFRDPVKIARLAKEMMETDPEMKAMIERDVEIATIDYTPADFTEMANQNNTSVYESLIKQGNTEAEIAVGLGERLEESKLRPADKFRADAMADGLDKEAADRAYVRSLKRGEIMSPHIDLISKLLGVDRRTIEHVNEPGWEARALGAVMSAVFAENRRSESIPIQGSGDAIEKVDIKSLLEEDQAMNAPRKKLETDLQTYLGNLAELATPGFNKTELRRHATNTSELLNSPTAQATLLAKLSPADKQNVQMAIDKYKVLSNQYVQSGVILAQVKSSASIDNLYTQYYRKEYAAGKKPLSKDAFKEAVDSKASTSKTTFRSFVTRGGDGLDIYRRQRVDQLQARAEEMVKGKSLKTGFTALNDVSGNIVKQTAALREGVISGSMPVEGTFTGEKSLDDILKRKYKYGAFTWDNSDIDTDAEVAEVRKNLKVLYNMEPDAFGRMTATVSGFPDGTTETVTLKDVPPSYGDGINQDFFASNAGSMSRSQGTNFMEIADIARGTKALTKVNVAQIESIEYTSGQALNDRFGLKITKAGIGSAEGKLYQLMIKDPNTGTLKVDPTIKPTTDYKALLGLIGKYERMHDWPVDGPGVFNPTR